jgi:seryl-tRNA synthetase
MLDISLIRENPEIVKKSLTDRQMETSAVDEVLSLDTERRNLLTKVEKLKAERNVVSKEIGTSKDQAERQKKIEAMREVGDEISKLDEAVRGVDEKLLNLLASIPNIPDPATPYGKDDSENVVLRSTGDLPKFDFTPLPHWELGVNLGIIDFERGTKLTGSRFYILNGLGARLQRAVIAYMIDLHNRQGYEERYTPFMVKAETLFSAGQLPKFADNLYHDIEEDYWMVPTAEVPLTGMYRDEVIEEAQLPMRFTAYTPCFRREKMSAGRDVRGIKRGTNSTRWKCIPIAHPKSRPTNWKKCWPTRKPPARGWACPTALNACAQVTSVQFHGHLRRGGLGGRL